MPFDGVPVATGGRAGQRRTGSERAGVVGGGPHEPGKGVEGEPGGGGHPLDLSDEGDEMVGGDRGGRVVGGAPLVVDDQGPAAQGPRPARSAIGSPATAKVMPDRRRSAPTAGVGQGHEGVERASPPVRGQHVEAQRSGQVEDDGALDGDHLRGHPGHLVVRAWR